MVTNMYAVFDVKSDTFGVPFCSPNDGMAKRSFMDIANNPDTLVGRHPEDFKLVRIGLFNDESGEVQAVQFASLGFGTEFVRKVVTNVS